jgi:hypothetical protein
MNKRHLIVGKGVRTSSGGQPSASTARKAPLKIFMTFQLPLSVRENEKMFSGSSQ